jgi:hypothetical protein
MTLAHNCTHRREFVGRLIAGAALAFAIALLAYSRGSSLFLSLIWLIVMLFFALGMRLAGSKARRELAARKQDDMDEFVETSRGQAMLDACLRREERRRSIRLGEIQDDGLSDYGREIAKDPELAQRNREFEMRFATPVGSIQEDLWSLEEEDRKIVSAWETKMLADSAWNKAREKYFKKSRR